VFQKSAFHAQIQVPIFYMYKDCTRPVTKLCLYSWNDHAWVSSQFTSQKAQLRAPLSPCKQPGLVSTLTCIAVGHPQQAPLWWKIATAKFFILNRGTVTDTMSVTPMELGWCAVQQP